MDITTAQISMFLPALLPAVCLMLDIFLFISDTIAQILRFIDQLLRFIHRVIRIYHELIYQICWFFEVCKAILLLLAYTVTFLIYLALLGICIYIGYLAVTFMTEMIRNCNTELRYNREDAQMYRGEENAPYLNVREEQQRQHEAELEWQAQERERHRQMDQVWQEQQAWQARERERERRMDEAWEQQQEWARERERQERKQQAWEEQQAREQREEAERAERAERERQERAEQQQRTEQARRAREQQRGAERERQERMRRRNHHHHHQESQRVRLAAFTHWLSTCDRCIGKGDRHLIRRMTHFPDPPAWDCGTLACQTSRCDRSLQACPCNIQELCQLYGENCTVGFWKEQRRKWHPDNFVGCPVVGAQGKAEELFKYFGKVLDDMG